MGKKEKLEKERERLHQLIERGAAKEEIQQQSEILDKHIFKFYHSLKSISNISKR